MTHPLLRKLETLGELSTEDRTLLDGLAMDVRDFPTRRDIIREGERPDHVHLMLEGWSCRYQVLPDGGRQITAFLVPGDFCDVHITMLGQMDHSIGALTQSRVAFISRALMLSLADRPAIAKAMWWASLVDEGVLRAWIVNLGRRDAFDRVAHLICELYARLRNVGLAEEGVFELPLTQEELSDALGLTSAHVGRVLKRLHREGLMSFKHQQIVITNIDELQRASGFDAGYLHLVARRPR